jgi:hypothetical protein
MAKSKGNYEEESALELRKMEKERILLLKENK